MLKRVYFDRFWGKGWPSLKELEPYFLGPPDKRWFYDGNDTATLSLQGVDGTEHRPPGNGRLDIVLYMTGNPDHGVQLLYAKSKGHSYSQRAISVCWESL